MAGRRFIDAARLFNASKSVAQQHIKLRGQQLDAFSKTSSLAKAAKNQTDRVTLTLEAACVLSQRLNEEAPKYAQAAARRAAAGFKNGDIPPREAARDKRAREGTEKGRDTFSKRSVPEPPKEPLMREGLGPVVSNASSTIPFPGQPAGSSVENTKGTQQDLDRIPAHANEPYRPSPSPREQKLQEGHDRDVFYTRSVESPPTTQSEPRSQIPEHTEDRQESDGHVRDGQLNQDVYYAVPEPAQEQLRKEENEDMPEGINTDIFHSPRVSKMLGGNPYKRRDNPEFKGKTNTPHDHTKTTQDHMQDTINEPNSEQTKTPILEQPATPAQPVQSEKPLQPATTEHEMHDLASKLAEDVDSASAPSSEVFLPVLIPIKAC
jgi:aarF domain-containing kinase